MKTNKKALKLIEMGLSPKTVLNLQESEITTLFKKFGLSEQGLVVVKKGTDPTEIKKMTSQGINVKVETEMTEDEEDPMDFEKGARTQDPHQVGPSTDDGYNDYGDGMPTESQMTEGNKKTKDNAWAICTSQLGKQFKTTERSEWSAKQKNKYERCVKDVKQSLKEGKDPYISLIEKEIVSLVERNLQPKMTKGDFMKMLSEQPTTAPTKPDVKPGVKPGTKPRTRPAHPGKNPNPGENPAPKAADKEKAKEDVIQVIMKLLKNGK
jgi:hypothetical protein